MSSISSPASTSPCEIIETEDLYIVPQDSGFTPEPESPQQTDEEQSQFALYLMSKVKKVRDRTTSLGFKPKKKRGKLRKEDIEFVSGEHTGPQEDLYSGLSNDEAFSESLYEALPGEMAYESLDLVAQAQRSLAPPPIPAENSGDSGFDEIDQARIKAWRDSMAPPPLPGNHPLQQQQHAPVDNEDENLYEMAVDCSNKLPGQTNAAWQNFYDSVHQSTNEIATWDMEDVAKCLTDLLLSLIHI